MIKSLNKALYRRLEIIDKPVILFKIWISGNTLHIFDLSRVNLMVDGLMG